MTLLLGLLAATSWGAADFLAGVLSRRSATAIVVFWSQTFGALLAGSLALLLSTPPTTPSVYWAIGAGLVSAFTLLFFYHALAVGQMSLVAPISACGALVPVLISLLTGHPVGFLTLPGMAAALTGVVLASLASSITRPGSQSWPSLLRKLQALGIGYAIATAGSMGVYLTLIATAANSASGSPLWVVAIARAASLVIVVPWTYRTSGGLGAPGGLLKGVLALAFMDTLGNVAYAWATTTGNYGVAAVLGSMYPIGTALLAVRFLGESLRRSEGFGVLTATLFAHELAGLGEDGTASSMRMG